MVAPSDMAMTEQCKFPSVLVIDDERGPRESLRILLKPEYRVLCADSVDAGLALLQEHHPDTVVMDIRMPGKSGIEGLRAIREMDRLVSVIMFTGFGALETAQEAIRLGANEYLKKPFDAFEIRGVIQRHVKRTQQKRRQQEAEGNLMELNRTLHEELERRKHLASLGQKSAELVHDLRNPLAVVLGYVELLSEKLRNPEVDSAGQEPDASTYLQHIERSVLRCRDLSEMWLDISRGRLRRTRVNMRDLLRSMVKECELLADRKKAKLSVESCDPGLMLEVDEVQLRRAIQNLISNAADAVEGHTGCIRVMCRRNGTAIEIGVEDNGCGMSEEQIRHVSEPFYTTKKERGGTGLGLFIARQVAEAHGGTFRIQSQPGRGTTITLTFPSGGG
jgi:signal transduction histidine kinase